MDMFQDHLIMHIWVCLILIFMVSGVWSVCKIFTISCSLDLDYVIMVSNYQGSHLDLL